LAAVTFFENVAVIVTRGGVERLENPVIEDEELHATERAWMRA
jgi:hypothetical protein